MSESEIKIYCATDLESRAKKMFDNFSDIDILFACCDGNVFIDENEAIEHSNGGKVTVFRRQISQEQRQGRQFKNLLKQIKNKN
ncbi:MAG: hypothetical protein M9958_03230 [Chitinophagales bacterium]|nr:hypothetical protein [Chitinophagales bacterium]